MNFKDHCFILKIVSHDADVMVWCMLFTMVFLLLIHSRTCQVWASPFACPMAHWAPSHMNFIPVRYFFKASSCIFCL